MERRRRWVSEQAPGRSFMSHPHLPEGARRTLASAHWNPGACVGLGSPFDPRPEQAHANWWWGIPGSALRSMLRTAGFEVVEEFRGPDWPFLTELVPGRSSGFAL